MHVSPDVWQKKVGSGWPQMALLLWLGEQKPHGPQSESVRQSLPVAHRFGAVSVGDGRHTHATLPAQSESA